MAWTDSQLQAITASGRNILVSAAAGSGKTAVLVERVIRRITGADNTRSVPADRFLVVTFTNAAAAELRERINTALSAAIENEEDEARLEYLISQKNLLPRAKICTIDSFCQSVVKENYQLLDFNMPAKFEILSNDEFELYAARVLDETLNELYALKGQEGEDFLALSEYFSNAKGDEGLSDNILKLYSKAEAFPFVNEWLDSLTDVYASDGNFSETTIGKLFIEQMSEKLDLLITFADKIVSLSNKSVENKFDKLSVNYSEAIDDLHAVKKKLANGSLNALLKLPASIRFSSSKIMSREDEKLKVMLKSVHEAFNELKKEIEANNFLYNEDLFAADCDQLNKIASKLAKVVKLFDERFLKFKIEHKRFTFGDIQHFALQLLSTKADENGKYHPTELALEMRDYFEEICIDEYQDTNFAQDLLFRQISHNNLFCVGDSKQSIYKFRNAQPEIFIEKAETYPDYTEAQNDEPAKIILKNNFRSRTGVTDFTNYVFSAVMSKRTGDINYNDDEKLVASFPYSTAEEKTELFIYEQEKGSSRAEALSEYVAEIIEEKIKNGFMIRDKSSSDSNKMRPCTPGDFTVLMRSVATYGKPLVQALSNKGIESYVGADDVFFTSYEISLMMNLLRVIDNPRQDIPLASVMMSVLYGFSPDEMAELRIADKYADLYTLINRADNNDKINSFLSDISKWRILSYTSTAAELIQTIYDETGIEAYVSVMTFPNAKRANLSLLITYASQYEKAGYTGLSGFIRYADRLKETKTDLEGAIEKSTVKDAVEIMTFHKSKGLQKPIVIVVHIPKRQRCFSECVISPKYGIALDIKGKTDTNIYYTRQSLARLVITDDEERKEISERLRVMYVALTRAEEKLIIVSEASQTNSGYTAYSKLLPLLPLEGDEFNPAAIATLNDDNLLIQLPLLLHPDCGELRKMAGAESFIPLRSGEGKFGVKIIHSFNISAPERKRSNFELEAQSDEAIMQAIVSAAEYTYPFLPLTKLLSKQAASEIENNSVNNIYFASRTPSFIQTNELTAAQKGTATHSFMQYVDFDAIKIENEKIFGVENEMQRLKENYIISESDANAIDIFAVKQFFMSSLGKRMMQSSFLIREKRFTIHIPMSEFDSTLSEFSDEFMTIQGIADAIFEENGELVIVDYKTDRMNTPAQFINHYRAQIKTYKKAIEQIMPGKRVKQTVLYSFYLNKSIEVN